MQQEDDLRGLARVMDFMRAVSILFVGINVYWFCYSTLKEWGVTFEVIDKILWNFQRTTGLFSSVLWTKLFAVVFLALSCIGTKGVKEEKITWAKIHCSLAAGVVLFFLNWWLLELPLPHTADAVFYIATLSAGYICMLMAGTWMSRLLKNNLMDDVFNTENESFQQETRLIENEYSVNLPTRFYYKKKWNNGWINVVNPFRASLVLGTPGSGKSYAVVNNYIKAPDMTPDGKPLLLGIGQDFMACIIGAAMCGVGLGITFNYNGSTGGTDIIAAVVNKYRDVSLGRMIMICDVFIIGSCYFIFHDWRRVIFGFVTLFIIGVVLDWIINSARQSVQFFIFSKKYDEIADRIIKDADRGVTVLDGTGWYSKNNVKVLVVLAKKRQSLEIFRLVKRIDPNAFISQSSVIGVYGEGFDKLKVK